MNKEIISTANAPKAIGPYEQAIKVGEFVYASGQIPLDPKTGNLVEGGITIQTRRVMENLKGVVEAAGSSLERVVKATVFLKNIGDFAAMNEVYANISARRSLPAPRSRWRICRAARWSRSILSRLCKIAPDQIPRIIRTRLCSTSLAALPKLLATRTALSSSSPRG